MDNTFETGKCHAILISYSHFILSNFLLIAMNAVPSNDSPFLLQIKRDTITEDLLEPCTTNMRCWIIDMGIKMDKSHSSIILEAEFKYD